MKKGYRTLGIRLPDEHWIWQYPAGQRSEKVKKLLEQGEMAETLLVQIETLFVEKLMEALLAQIEVMIDRKLEEHLKRIEDLIQEKMKHAAFEKGDDFFRKDDDELKKERMRQFAKNIKDIWG